MAIEAIESVSKDDPTRWPAKTLAGQRLMIGFDSNRLDHKIRDLIDSCHPGAIILFACNLDTPDQIKTLCEDLQAHAAKCGLPPLFIGIDQEGGPVARLKKPFTIFKGHAHMKSVADAIHFATVTATELVQMGINMNMAPVLDVLPADMQSIMIDRSLGHDPIEVGRLGRTIIEYQQNNGLMAVAKHFPGIGRTVLDSHLDLPYLEADMETLAQSDLLPFETAIKSEVAGIMLSHILYTRIDDQLPASLSPKIAKSLLRDQMGYTGVVMTDDLDMGAIEKHFSLETILNAFVESEVDIAMICHYSDKIGLAHDLLTRSIQDVPRNRILSEMAVKRILTLKRRFLSS